MVDVVKYEAAMIEQLRDLMRALEDEIRKLIKLPPGESRAIRMQNALKAREQIAATIARAGALYEDETARAAVLIALDTIRESDFLPDGFAPDVAQEIDQAISGRFKELSEAFGNMSEDVNKALMRGAVAGLPTEDIAQQISKQLGKSEAVGRTVTTTAIHSASRAALVDTADETGADFVYAYVGPLDIKTRPFCRFYGFPDGGGSKVAYTRDALRVMSRDPTQQNQPGGEMGDVSAALGGYNCRHGLAPIFIEEAIEEGYEIRDAEAVAQLIAGGGAAVLK